MAVDPFTGLDDPILSVLVPIQINDSNLTSSTVPEADYPAWSAVPTYPVGERTTRAHRIYESARDGNTNHDPTVDANRAPPAPWWLDIGPTNRYAMFDGEISTQTEADTSVTVVLHPGPFNAIFLAGLDAEDLAITVRDSPGGAVTESVSTPLEASAPPDYWEHFYDPYKPQTDYMLTGIDPYHDAELEVTVSRSSGLVKIGILVVGDNAPLGLTLKGATAEPRSFNYIKTDDFGRTTIKKRKNARDMTAIANVDIAEANSVLEKLTAVMGIPVVLSGTNLPQYSGLRGFGLVNGRLVYDKVDSATLNVTLQGLI